VVALQTSMFFVNTSLVLLCNCQCTANNGMVKQNIFKKIHGSSTTEIFHALFFARLKKLTQINTPVSLTSIIQ